MEKSASDNNPKIDCYVSPEITSRLLVLRHKNRNSSRPLETEFIKESRIKASLDHLEINIGDGRLENIKASAEKKDAYTLRSIPDKNSSTLLGYFINVSEFLESPIVPSQPPTSSSTVVSARMRTEAEMFGAKRLASRRKTAENDEDLRYLSQLSLTPWRPSRFKPFKSLYAYENRICLMCTADNVSHDCHEFTQEYWDSKLLAPLREDASEITPMEDDKVKKLTLEELVRNILVKVQVIKFEKLMDCLRGRASDKIKVTPNDVIGCLNKCAVLVKGWWAVRSDVLYPPNSLSEHAAVPSTHLIRARDYVMAVFHRGGHLTRKTVSSVTKLPSLEVTEIMESLGHRISSGTEGHNNHWEFRPPDADFIKSHPDVVHQHAENWELRIRQLCSQLKLDVLVSDAVQRRRRCSGRLSGSDTDDLFTSPRGQRRCRLLSHSPDQSQSSSHSTIRSPPTKRARTKSACTSGDQVAVNNLSSTTSAGSNNVPQTPPLSVNDSSLPKSPTGGTNVNASTPIPPPPLFNEGVSSRSASPPPLPPSVPKRTQPPTPAAVISMASAMQAAKLSLSLRVATDPSGDLLKQEPKSPGGHSMETDLSPTIQAPSLSKTIMPPAIAPSILEKVEEPDRSREYSMVDDPEIRTFVKEKLRTLPILALSELTKACQPFLASLGTNPMSRSGITPPPGSEAERTMLSSELYKVILAVGGCELKIEWPKVSWALPKQPLFVAPVADEFGDTSSPYSRVREVILERLENNQFVTFGYIKQKLAESGLKITDNNLRTTIKRYCIYRQSKYFLRYTVDERP
nr:DNA directed RNA polymerase III subunit RPC5 [Hymenolepis microstoma]